MHVLRSPKQFVVNLHGVIDNASSWVLTKRSLDNLLSNRGYRTFLEVLLSTRAVIMIGLRADDLAIASTLTALRDNSISFQPPFWITERNDWETFRWAQHANIRPVFYEPTAPGHAGLITLLEDLASYTPRDEPAAPVPISTPLTADGPLPPQTEILHLDADSLRRHLNARAQEILRESTPRDYSLFAEFTKDYDEAIHRAWYVTTDPPKNSLLGYSLEEEIASGAFGTVYRGTSPTGERVAIKILREAIRRKDQSVQSFRRGVRSMKILSRHQLHGMVPYIDASEIPAMVVMAFIDGMDLRKAILAKQLPDWESFLYYAIELTDVIRSAHELPERVLHRDIRPANIMLSIDPGSQYGYKLVVLDFDLSWHRGSLEESVAQGAARYLAPEQIEVTTPYTTRSAAVDAYGIGMTMYHMCTGEEPDVLAHRGANWLDNLRTRVAKKPCDQWRSLPARIARLIASSTQEAQPSRLDVVQINKELKRLRSAFSGEEVKDADLLAEELLVRTEIVADYEWRESEWAAIASLYGGVQISIHGDETHRLLRIRIERSDRGTEDRKRIGKYLAERLPEIRALLERKGWRTESAAQSQRSALVLAESPTSSVSSTLQGNAEAIARALQRLSLS